MAEESSSNIYEFDKVDKESIEIKHGEKIQHEILNCAFGFIEKRSRANIKGSFELIIREDSSEEIRLIAGGKQHKFLATYDSNGKPKIRRFVGAAELKPDGKPFKTWPFHGKHTDTPFKIMTEMMAKEEKQAAIGLLCMRIAKFLERSEKDITCNTEIAFYDDAGKLYTISAGKRENNILASFDSKGNPIIVQFKGEEYSFSPSCNDFVYECDKIDKVAVGHMIIKVCGNEAMTDDENTAKTRKLLHSLITYLGKEEKKDWKNAEITICDRNYDYWKLRCKNVHIKFVANLDGEGECRIEQVSPF